MPVSRYCTTILDFSAINYLRFEILPINQRSIYLLNVLYVFMIFLFLHKNRITYLNKYREKYKYEYKLYEIK